MKTPAKNTRCAIFLLMAAAVVVLDQLSKAWLRQALPNRGDRMPFIPNVLELLHVENSGAAFSMGEGKGFVFIAIAVAIAVFAFAIVLRENISVSFTISLAAVAGGGIGNMIDRIAKGTVTDFFATTFIDFPVFNVADIFVTLGVIACLICLFKEEDVRG